MGKKYFRPGRAQVHRFVSPFVLTGLWWFTDQTAWASLPDFIAWRNGLIQSSGVLGIGVVSAAMILAIRPVLVGPYLGAGPDVPFCGPARFGQGLKKNFVAMGSPEAHFHQELFEMR